MLQPVHKKELLETDGSREADIPLSSTMAVTAVAIHPSVLHAAAQLYVPATIHVLCRLRVGCFHKATAPELLLHCSRPARTCHPCR